MKYECKHFLNREKMIEWMNVNKIYQKDIISITNENNGFTIFYIKHITKENNVKYNINELMENYYEIDRKIIDEYYKL